MTHLTNYLRNHSTPSGLCCVWVPLHNDGRPPLICIWIDPKMTALQPKPPQESIGLAEAAEDVMAEETEDPKSPFAVVAVGVNLAAESALNGTPVMAASPRL